MSSSQALVTWPDGFTQAERIPAGVVCLFGLDPGNIETDQVGSKIKEGTPAIRGAILGDERPTYAYVPDERRWVLVDVVRRRARVS